MKYPEIIKTLILLVIGAFVGQIAETIIVEKALSSSNLMFGTLLLLVGLLALIVFDGASHLGKLQRRVGIEVSYIDREDGENRSKVFRKARAILASAKSSIVILNSPIWESGMYFDSEEVAKERDDYYEMLLTKARDGVEYVRLVQIRKDQNFAELFKNDLGYVKHFHRILDEQAAGTSIGFLKVKAKHVSTFVLVDDATLIWQVNEMDDSGITFMRGIFVFDDPRQEIISHFKDFIRRLRNDTIGKVNKEELPQLPI